MDEKLPFGLITFFSTLGHGGFRESYKATVEDLAQNIDLDLFPVKLANIKYPTGEREIALKMEEWLEDKGIRCILNEGNWADNDVSKHKEYLSDVIKLLHDNELNTLPFTFWVEGDVILRIREGKLVDYLQKSAQILVNNKNILRIGISDRLDEFERINGVKEKHGLDRQAIRVEGEDNFYLHNDLFNFRVSICRQRDLFQASRILLHNFEKLSYHCEMGFSDSIKMLSDERYCFVDFEPTKIIHIHGQNEEFKYKI